MTGAGSWVLGGGPATTADPLRVLVMVLTTVLTMVVRVELTGTVGAVARGIEALVEVGPVVGGAVALGVMFGTVILGAVALGAVARGIEDRFEGDVATDEA